MNVLLVGAGAYARAHARAISGVPGLQVTGVVDRSADRAAALAVELGVPSFTEVDRACSETRPHLATVVVPTIAHVDVAVRVLRQGVHVLLEKPLARTAAECAELAAEAARSELRVDVVSQRRFQEGAAAVKEAVSRGLLGRIGTAHLDTSVWREDTYFTEAMWRGRAADGGGNLLNHGWHALDLLIWYLGSPAEARGFRTTSRVPGVDIEESLAAALLFPDGRLASVEASLVARGGSRMRLTLTGDRGTAWVEDRVSGLAHVDDAGDMRELRWESTDADAALRTQYASLLYGREVGGGVRVGLDEALRTQRAADLILAAVADG